FPLNVSNIGVDLLHLIKATWNTKEVMNGTDKILNNRKMKIVKLNVFITKSIPVLPLSFIR
ncbi:hypothetical protein CLU79DRAFT_684200, partial [Phycomyces nitens]